MAFQPAQMLSMQSVYVGGLGDVGRVQVDEGLSEQSQHLLRVEWAVRWAALLRALERGPRGRGVEAIEHLSWVEHYRMHKRSWSAERPTGKGGR
jgi:hypothetical protein